MQENPDQVKHIADKGNQRALDVTSAFGDIRLAETACLERMALERINAIERLEESVKREPPAEELEMQRILQNAFWLVEPQWTVLQANRAFSSFQDAFETWYKKQKGTAIKTSVDTRHDSKRPDFVMIVSGNCIEIVEIKRPGHKFNNGDFERLNEHAYAMEEFIDKNKSFRETFPNFHLTLVCDDVKLSGVAKRAYASLVNEKKLHQKTWMELLSDARHVHDDFLKSRDHLLKRSVG